jgi:hypothetical protein
MGVTVGADELGVNVDVEVFVGVTEGPSRVVVEVGSWSSKGAM